MLLKTGWQAQNLKFAFCRLQLIPADRLAGPPDDGRHAGAAARLRSSPRWSASSPPAELLQEVGLSPYNAEGILLLSVGVSRRSAACLQQAENTGIAETLCSYHKTFLGAAQRGLLPKPRCIVYTSLTCDANLVTFRALCQLYDVPACSPSTCRCSRIEDNVRTTWPPQLRALAAFSGGAHRQGDRRARPLRVRLRTQQAHAWRLLLPVPDGPGRPVCARRTWCPRCTAA